MGSSFARIEVGCDRGVPSCWGWGCCAAGVDDCSPSWMDLVVDLSVNSPSNSPVLSLGVSGAPTGFSSDPRAGGVRERGVPVSARAGLPLPAARACPRPASSSTREFVLSGLAGSRPSSDSRLSRSGLSCLAELRGEHPTQSGKGCTGKACILRMFACAFRNIDTRDIIDLSSSGPIGSATVIVVGLLPNLWLLLLSQRPRSRNPSENLGLLGSLGLPLGPCHSPSTNLGEPSVKPFVDNPAWQREAVLQNKTRRWAHTAWHGAVRGA